MISGTLLVALSLAGAQAGPDGVPAPIADAPAPSPVVVDQPAPADETSQAPATAPQASQDASPAPNPAPADPEEPTEDLVVTARSAPPAEDPMQDLNVKSFQVVTSVDEAVTGPVARTYKKSLPSPLRSGLRNVLANLEEPVVFLNYLLQLKPGKSMETLGRFAINSTVGAAGLFDVAKKRPFNLPRRDNGFAYTLGYYGVKSGPYLYLPLMGPTTIRDFAGRMLDLSVLPFAVGKPFSELAYVVPTTTIRLIDERAEADEAIQETADGPRDPYNAVREDYLRKRQAEIDALRGKVPEPAPKAEPAGETPPRP